jgi:hypothetical protein
MLNLKKTAVAVLALSSSAVFAGTMGPVCTAGNVTVPCERNAWELSAYALYLKASYNHDLAWFGATVPAGTATTSFIDSDLDWGWGFRLEAAYHFLTGNDFNVNWSHYNHSSDLNYSVTGADAGTYFVDIEPRWDAVNLELGQHVNFGEFKNIRFHGGVQFVRIKTELSQTGVTPAGVALGGGFGMSSRFNGFGPRTGADMSFDWGNGFGIYAKPAAALLVGKSKFSGANSSGTPATTSSVYGSRTAIVPELEAKLGLTYGYAMPQGDLALDAGWMFVDYIGGQDNAIFMDGFAPGHTDFALQGPYIGLKWVGSVV